MSHIYKISLEQDTPSHLIVDAIYEGGNSIEVISKLMLVGVQECHEPLPS